MTPAETGHTAADGSSVQSLRDAVWAMQDPGDIQAVLATLGRALPRLCPGAVTARVSEVDEVTGDWTRYRVDAGGVRHEAPSLRCEPAAHQAWRRQQPLYRPDLTESDPYGERESDAIPARQVQCVLDLPIRRGVLSLLSDRPRAFGTGEYPAGQVVGQVLADAFARLEDLRDRAYGKRRLVDHSRMLAASQAVARAATDSLKEEEVLNVLAAQLVSTGLLHCFLVAVVRPEATHLEVVRVHPEISAPRGEARYFDLASDSPLARVASTGRMEVVEGPQDWLVAEPADLVGQPGQVTYVIPVRRGERTLAVVATWAGVSQRDDAGRRVGLITPLMDQVAAALEHARLYQQATARADELRQLNRALQEEIAARQETEKKLEREVEDHTLAQERSRFQAELLRGVREAIIATDEAGVLMYWGSGAESLFGLSAEGALGQPIGILGAGTEGEAGPEGHLAEAREEGTWRGECRYRLPDGTLVWVDSILSARRDHKGAIRGFVCAARDVSTPRRGELRRQAVARVRERVWELGTDGDLGPVVEAVAHGLDQVGVLYHVCGMQLTVGDPHMLWSVRGTEDGVHRRPLTRDTTLQRLKGFQEGQTPVYRPDLQQHDPLGEARRLQHRFGVAIRSVLDVPFSHGTLAVNSTEAHAFSSDDIDTLEEMAQAVADGCRRRDDLLTLQQSEARYRRIVGAVTDYVYQVRVEASGHLRTWHSEGCMAVTGYSPEDIASSPHLWLEIAVEEDRPAVLEQAQRARRGELTPALEYRIVRRDGQTRWIRSEVVPRLDDQGAVAGYDGTVRDVTERRQAEEEVRQREAALRSILDASHSAIVLHDREGRILDGNHVLFERLGLPAEQVVGRVAWDLVPPDVAAARRPAVEQVFATGDPLEFQDERDGMRLSNSLYPVRGPYGRVQAVVVDSRDITAEVRAQEARRRAEASLAESSRLIALGGLAAGIAHELNQPLTVISVLSEGLEVQLEEGLVVSGEQQLQWSRQIQDAVDRMRHVMDHLRDFARDRRVKQWDQFPVNEVVEGGLTLMGSQLQTRGIRVDLSLAQGIPPIAGDRFRLEQVVVNLLANARDALEERWDADACEARKAETMLLELSTGGDAEGVWVEIADNGVGMADEVLSRLFEPFVTTKAERGGTGLGLSISHGIIQEHGGSLQVRPNPGGGARWRIDLPVAAAGGPALGEQA